MCASWLIFMLYCCKSEVIYRPWIHDVSCSYCNIVISRVTICSELLICFVIISGFTDCLFTVSSNAGSCHSWALYFYTDQSKVIRWCCSNISFDKVLHFFLIELALLCWISLENWFSNRSDSNCIEVELSCTLAFIFSVFAVICFCLKSMKLFWFMFCAYSELC
jgi:hypothetical protein